MTLEVDTGIPYANACDVTITQQDGSWVLSFAADPHGGPESLWFCLRLINKVPIPDASNVKLVLKNLRNMLGAGDPSKILPVARQEGGEWRRMERGQLEELLDGRRQATWLLAPPNPTTDVAVCYPYGRPDLDRLLDDTGGYWKADVIGVSQGGRPMLRLSNGCGEKGSQRPGLYLLARQHSGETPGSWVLDGVLRCIASMGDRAPLVWAVPLANPDGVEGGDYGKDNFPYDLNRAWGDPPMRHEVLVMRRDMAAWRERCRPFAGVDYHAPGLSESLGIYAFLPNPDQFKQEHERATRLADSIAKALTPRYAADPFGRVPTYHSRWDTPGFLSYCCSQGFPGFCLETPYSLAGDLVLTCDQYREAGSLIGRCLAEEAFSGS